MTTRTRETLKEISLDKVRKYLEENGEDVQLLAGSTIVHNIYGEGEISRLETSPQGITYLYIEFQDPSRGVALVKKFPLKNVVETFFSRLCLVSDLYSKVCSSVECSKEERSPLEDHSIHSRVMDTVAKNENGRSRQEILKECRVGDIVLLSMNPDNDQIAVSTEQKEVIGYLPGEVTELIVPAIEKNLPVEGMITSIPKEGTAHKRGCRLEIYLNVPGRENPRLKNLSNKRQLEKNLSAEESDVASPEERPWDVLGEEDMDDMVDQDMELDMDQWDLSFGDGME